MLQKILMAVACKDTRDYRSSCYRSRCMYSTGKPAVVAVVDIHVGCDAWDVQRVGMSNYAVEVGWKHVVDVVADVIGIAVVVVRINLE